MNLPPLHTPPAERPRFLSEADCQEILQRVQRFAVGGGETTLFLWSTWTGNVRWGRNRVTTSGEVRNDYVRVQRTVNGAFNKIEFINDTSDAALVAATRRAERMAILQPEDKQVELYRGFEEEPGPTALPRLFFDTTYQLDAARRAEAARHLMQSAASAGMLSAGYIEVAAHGLAVLDTVGHARYLAYTTAQYSVTVRDPQGTGSGWAGVDGPDWSRIDGDHLSAVALDKCLTSRNPVAIEPGRYTTILEAQAVCDLVAPLINSAAFLVHEPNAEAKPTEGPFGSLPPTWQARRGTQVIDPRLTIRTDPTDPELAFPPFNPLRTDIPDNCNLDYEVYHPVTWIDHGILTNLAYERQWALRYLAQNTGLPNAGAFRMSVEGPTASIAEMIATTKRGLLVTRLSEVGQMDYQSQLYRGITRDGLWLIENGKISKPVKNMVFTESTLFALNNVEELGAPQRAFHPKVDAIQAIPQPVIVPALKVRDFSFTALCDAV